CLTLEVLVFPVATTSRSATQTKVYATSGAALLLRWRPAPGEGLCRVERVRVPLVLSDLPSAPEQSPPDASLRLRHSTSAVWSEQELPLLRRIRLLRAREQHEL